MRDRRSCTPMVEMSIPSIRIRPPAGSTCTNAVNPRRRNRKSHTHKTQNAHRKRALAAPRPAEHADPLPGIERKRHAVQHRGEVRCVFDDEIFCYEERCAAGVRWPVGWGAIRLDDRGRLLREVEVFYQSFYGALCTGTQSVFRHENGRITHLRSSSRFVQNLAG